MSQPQRIASLLASSTEILYGLGLGDRVIAVSHECDFPSEVRTKPQVTFAHVQSGRSSKEIDDQVKEMVSTGAALYEVDWDRLADLKPDLIVTQAQCDVCAVSYDDVLNNVESRPEFKNVPVVALNPMTIDDVFNDVRKVAKATQAETVDQYVASLKDRVDQIANISKQLLSDELRRVACIEWIEPLMISANWMPRLIELAGGRQDLTKDGHHSGYTDWQRVVTFDPEVVVVMPCGFDLERSIVESKPLRKMDGWNELTAVKNNEVFAVDGNAYFNRSGPRIIDSLGILAHLIHPEYFAPPQFSYSTDRAWQRI